MLQEYPDDVGIMTQSFKENCKSRDRMLLRLEIDYAVKKEKEK